jgi:hypothetical protein
MVAGPQFAKSGAIERLKNTVASRGKDFNGPSGSDF